jgi:hypothetical protein
MDMPNQYAKDVSVEDIRTQMRLYGDIRKASETLGINYGTLINRWAKYSKTSLPRFPVMNVKVDGKTVEVRAHNIHVYLKTFDLFSMEDDQGYLSRNIKEAVRNAGRPDKRGIMKGQSEDMKFVFKKTQGNDKLEIKELKVRTDDIEFYSLLGVVKQHDDIACA